MGLSSRTDLGLPNRFDVRVSGRVQGVGFRAFVVRKARGLNLTGFVRNHRDGSVEVRAHGRRVDLDTFESYLASGPAASRVDTLDVRWSRDDNPPERFDVQR